MAPVYTPDGEGEIQEAFMVVEATPVIEPKLVPSSTPDVSALRPTQRNDYFTKTVYGFLDFTTTVGSTVMVFTPESKANGEYYEASPGVKVWPEEWNL